MDAGDQRGGSRVLAELIDEYGGVLIPDLLHYYGVDLRDLFHETEPLDPKWVLCLILGLDPDGAYVAERRGGQQFRGWNPGVYAQAQSADRLGSILYSYLLTHLDERHAKKLSPPKPFPVPDAPKDQTAPPKPNSFGGIVASMMAAARRAKESKDGG